MIHDHEFHLFAFDGFLCQQTFLLDGDAVLLLMSANRWNDFDVFIFIVIACSSNNNDFLRTSKPLM
jgi:hypothetical protein